MLKPFARALRYLPRYRAPLLVGLLSIPFAQALGLLIPLFIGRRLDELTRGEPLRYGLAASFWILLAMAAVKGLFKFTMRHYVVGASRRFEEDLRNDVFRHLLTLPRAFFQQMRTGDVMARATSDVEAVRMFLGPGTMYLTETFLILPPALILLSLVSPLLTALVVLPLLLIVWAMKHYAEPIHRESQRAQEELSALSNLAQENFAGVRVVRAFARERREVERFEAMSATYLDQNLRVARVRGRSWTLLMGAKDLGMFVILGVGCYELIQGRISEGDFFVFLYVLNLLFWPMVALGWMVGMYQRAKVSMRRLDEILTAAPALGDGARAHHAGPVRGAIEFRGLRAGYGDREVLKGIDLVVAPGTVLGVTGRTGSGKSTLAQVLPRLVPVQPGMAFVDGVDLTRWDARALRRAVGYVPQETFLFADTLRANLALGRDDEDEEAVVAAARSAHVHEELARLPGGYAAVVGERGVTLSGGQRQRATLARALAADPRILVLDDCLSAVDAETEARILADLTAELRGRTSILVSHRVSALGLADVVIVLDDGRIVEQGAPGELLARRGPFHELFLRQRAEEELERMG